MKKKKRDSHGHAIRAASCISRLWGMYIYNPDQEFVLLPYYSAMDYCFRVVFMRTYMAC